MTLHYVLALQFSFLSSPQILFHYRLNMLVYKLNLFWNTACCLVASYSASFSDDDCCQHSTATFLISSRIPVIHKWLNIKVLPSHQNLYTTYAAQNYHVSSMLFWKGYLGWMLVCARHVYCRTSGSWMPDLQCMILMKKDTQGIISFQKELGASECWTSVYKWKISWRNKETRELS